MKTFESKTGYIKRTATGEVYQGNIIYLGSHDSVSNYSEATEEEYEAFLKEQEEKAKAYFLNAEHQ